MDFKFELQEILGEAGESHERISDKTRSYIDFAMHLERKEHCEITIRSMTQALRLLKYSLSESEEGPDRSISNKINELIAILGENFKKLRD